MITDSCHLCISVAECAQREHLRAKEQSYLEAMLEINKHIEALLNARKADCVTS